MKRNFFKFIPLILGAVMTLSSCGEDDGEDPVAASSMPTASVTINGTADQSTYEVTVGDPIIISISAQKGDKDLDKIKVVQNGPNAITTGVGFTFNSTSEMYDLENNIEVSIKNADDETLLIKDTLTGITANVGVTTYTFTITDKSGNVATAAFDISVSAPATPFTVKDTGVVYHIGGSLAGSWSLTSDASVSSAMASTMADISNTDMAANPFTGSFKVGDTRTGTDFVIALSTFDYSNATVTSAQAAYAAGTAVTSASNPSVGDVYIFDLNGSFSVVKVLELDAADNTCSCANTGKMRFEYQK